MGVPSAAHAPGTASERLAALISPPRFHRHRLSRDPKFPQVWELEIPHLLHDSVSSVSERDRPSKLSFKRVEAYLILRRTLH